MKTRILISISAITLLAALAISVRLAAQDNWDGKHAKFILFDAPDAGTGAGQGTVTFAINPVGTITGYYLDSSNVYHGFLRAKDGSITTIDAPGAGTGPGQGTVTNTINPAGAIAGYYCDGVTCHGLLRARDGAITSFDAPGVATFGASINPAGTIVGFYLDASDVYHAFLRARDGAITTLEPPGAGTGQFQGTFACIPDCINPAGAVAGTYSDDSNVSHSFVRAPDGAITKYDVAGAGTGQYQGTTAFCNNPGNTVTGWYTDASGVNHGFLWRPRGAGDQEDEDGEHNPSASEGNAAPVTQLPSTVVPVNPVLRTGFPRLAPAPMN